MDLYMKQDFTPPVLSGRWIASKFRPNMLLHSRLNIILILESGLMFREDSIEVEQEAPSPEAVWRAAGGAKGGWLTRGEGALTAATLAACVTMFPPRSFSRVALINLSLYMAVPIAIRCTHRAMCCGALPALLRCMRDYLALARRAAACLMEFAALHTQLGSLSCAAEAGGALLRRQQRALAGRLARASAALLQHAPWLRGDVVSHRDDTDNLTKIHHAFLVVQSTFLKHLAMAHFIPPPDIQRFYKNHNERLYWIHNTLIQHLLEEFKTNYESLERMYRLIKNSANRDDSEGRKLGAAVKSNWVYSEVHTGIARVCLELKLALSKSIALDVLLDSCAMTNQVIQLDVLNKDVDDLIDIITKCLTTMQSSQLRLMKLKGKLVVNAPSKADVVLESTALTQIEDRLPETKDEVFYFMKTEDDDLYVPSEDVTTGPGKKERKNTEIVLTELKRKLGKREDIMRERERQALVKTMPELKDIPEFPRQIKFDEYIVRKGYISKIKRKDDGKRLFRHYKIQSRLSRDKRKKYALKVNDYVDKSDIKGDLYEANTFHNVKSKLFTITSIDKDVFINRWCKAKPEIMRFDSSSFSECDDKKASSYNQIINNQVKLKLSKKDLELSQSSSESDFEYYKNQRALLNDIRRHRVVRKKNHPTQRVKPIENVDESLRPIEYSFGAGLAMASVLQVNNPQFLNLAQEEVFNGDGEVSNDSGNDEDA